MATALLVSNRIAAWTCIRGGANRSIISIRTLSRPLASYPRAPSLMVKSWLSINRVVPISICCKIGCAMPRCGSFILSSTCSFARTAIAPNCRSTNVVS